MDTKERYTKNIIRFLIWLAGIAILALGSTMNTKTMLGVSPIISIPYNISTVGAFPLGTVTFLYYVALVLVQILILRKNFKPFQLLQVIMSFLTSAFIQLFDNILSMAPNVFFRCLMVVVAIICTGIGVALTVGMKLVPNPADGMADVIGEKLKKGIGLGTVLAMIFIGRVVALCQKPVKWLYGKVQI